MPLHKCVRIIQGKCKNRFDYLICVEVQQYFFSACEETKMRCRNQLIPITYRRVCFLIDTIQIENINRDKQQKRPNVDYRTQTVCFARARLLMLYVCCKHVCRKYTRPTFCIVKCFWFFISLKIKTLPFSWIAWISAKFATQYNCPWRWAYRILAGNFLCRAPFRWSFRYFPHQDKSLRRRQTGHKFNAKAKSNAYSNG